MPYAIRGRVLDASNPSDPLRSSSEVRLILDVGAEFNGQPRTSLRDPAPWTGTSDIDGYFAIALSDSDVETILDGRRHREVILKVYDNQILIASQSVHVSMATFRGTESIQLLADPASIPTDDSSGFVVSGFVVEADGRPIPSTPVILSEKKLRNDSQFPAVSTDSAGRFLIRYDGGPGRLGVANMTVFLSAAAVSASTGDLCNPPNEFTVRLVRDNAPYVGRSQFALDVATISPLLDSAPLVDLNVDDLKFLRCRTQHDSSVVATLVRAHALAERYSLPAAAFAALAAAGVSLSTLALTALSAEEIDHAIRQAIADNIVPSTLAAQIPTVVATLAAARIDRLVPTTSPATTPLGAILVASGHSTPAARLFAETYAAHTGTAEQFWSTLRTKPGFGPAQVARTQFALQAGAISGGHPPLVKLLDQLRTNGHFTSAAELARYEESDWVHFMGQTVDGSEVDAPAGFVGAPGAERRGNYAAAITRMVADLYPSAHVAYRLPAGSVTTDVASFVIQNPGFSFDRTNINELLPPLPANQDLRQDLLKVQRVFAISPRYGRTAAASALLSAGVTSASQIHRMGRAAFNAKFAPLMDARSLKTTYEKAEQVATTALHSWLSMRPEMHFPPVAVIPPPSSLNADIQAAFTSHDYCACPPCESVLSPAAYFLDIMQYVYRREPGGPAAMFWMATRRPELLFVFLSCENSETPLPTIDLIIEVLELRAHGHLSIGGSLDNHRQTTWTADDLLVYPENINLAVYARLADPAQACYPLNLPFDLAFEEAREYLAIMGTSRVEIQDQLEWFAGFGQSEPYRVNERLGLSSGEASILRQLDGTPPLEVLWGFEEGDPNWGAEMNAVELFLARTGLDFDGLKELLRTKDLIGRAEVLFTKPCTLAGARLVSVADNEFPGVDGPRFRMLQAFFRLKRALGWTTAEFDATSRALDLSFISAGFGRLAHFVRLRRRFERIPLGELNSWFAPLDRTVYREGEPSYYESVVRPNLLGPAFIVFDDSKQLGDFRDELLSILRFDDATLDVALAATGLVATSVLNLANLSALHRVASIARALDLPVTDLIALTKYRANLVAAPGAFVGTPDAPVRDLVDLAEAVRSAGFTVPELDWVLSGIDRGKFGGDNLSVMRVLVGLIGALQKAEKDHQQSLPPESMPALEQVERLLSGPLPAEKVAEAMRFIRKLTTPAPGNYVTYRKALLFFLTNGSPAANQLDTAFAGAGAGTAEARATLLLPELVSWLRRQALERAVIQQLATAFSLDVADTDALLRNFTNNGLALDAFTSDAFFAKSSFDPDVDGKEIQDPKFSATFLRRTALIPVAGTYRALRRVALLAAKFRLGPGLLQWLLLHPADGQVELPDLAHLTGQTPAEAYLGWDWLRRAIRLRDQLFDRNSDTLTQSLDSFFAADFVKHTVLINLAPAAGWDPDTLEDFEAAQPIVQLDLKRLGAVEAFAAAFRLARQLGVHPNTVRSWAKEPVTAATAAEIRKAAWAKVGDGSWTSVAHPVRDRLRVKQRDALADFIVHKEGLHNREDLFGLLLMDVDLSPCNRTTRLLFCTAAVQLFVQRALMGLVPTVTLSDADAVEWAWMKRYRVWEANRKVFLYPENWILPELRDDKTQLFKRLEDELSQGQIDETSVEKAVIHYLEGLRELAHLEPSGMYHEFVQDNDGVVWVDRMHVVARSDADPSRMFYRYREKNTHWTAWEELPFQIDHKGVLPVVINRRLMLIWPQIHIRTKRPSTYDSSLATMPAQTEYPEIGLAWAERMNDGWSRVFFSEDRVAVKDHRAQLDTAYGDNELIVNREDIHLTSEIVDDVLSIHVICPTQVSGNDSWSGEVAKFTYRSCKGTFGRTLLEESASYYAKMIVAYGVRLWRNQGVTIERYTFASNFIVKLKYGDDKTEYPVIQTQNAPSNFLFPRQQREHDTTRPFLFSDRDVVLYMEPADPPKFADASVDAKSVGQISEESLLPYLGLSGIKTAPLSPPKDHDLLTALSGGDNVASEQALTGDLWKSGYQVSPFFHPYACLFIERVRKFGIEGLLDPARVGDDTLRYQAINESLHKTHDYFQSIKAVPPPPPRAIISFSERSTYGVYNWEIFFHIPMLVADRLMAERRFADAQRWLGYIFNPLRKPTKLDPDKAHFWEFKPFRDAAENTSIEWLLELLHYDGDEATLKAKKQDMIAQIDRSRANPFRPHDLARARPTAYMRSVVMKYLDNLIAWGDDLFRQDTRESTQEAAQLYILALQILGPRPRKVNGESRPDKDWAAAVIQIDEFSNFLVELENDAIGFTNKEAAMIVDPKAQADYQANFPTQFQFSYIAPTQTHAVSDAAKQYITQPPPILTHLPKDDQDEGAVKTRLYFCIPPNDKLLGYWDTIADRLFKLRNCLNIEGIRRDLALYDPPIDPALLVKAVAQGIDIGTAISNLYAPLPHYRFLPHLSIAKDFVAQVGGLGSALLQALEKRDAEELATLRGSHELDLLKLIRGVKVQAIREAADNLEAVRRGREVALLREKYYKAKSHEFMNELEKKEVELSLEASAAESTAAGYHRDAARLVALLPGISLGWTGIVPTVSTSFGGSLAAWPSQSKGDEQSTKAQSKSREAARTTTQASYTRRRDDWDLQASLATAELSQLDAQITAAEIRLQMTELELANHDKQVEQSADALAVMQIKFTNAELYSWLRDEISKLYHLAYQMALDLSRRAERCYRYELAVDPESPDFVQIGHWDNRRQGLLAGERLAQDLRRMEAAYYENNRREYELTKRISLAGFDPVALISLRKTGACHINLPSVLFNLDHASHFMRRIKLVSVAIPAVTGPYTNIGMTLTYESGKLRRKPTGEAPEKVLGTAQSVAISVSQDDTGLFEPNMRDERYLPFEGRALEDSKWRLELPPVLRQFDYETISDVILTIRYTAREGGAGLASHINQSLQTQLQEMAREENAPAITGQVQVFSARAEFPEAWRLFVAEGANGPATLSLGLDERRFPHPVPAPGERTIEGVTLFARWAADGAIAPAPGGVLFEGSVLENNDTTSPVFGFNNFKNDIPAEGEKYNYLWFATPAIGTGQPLGAWTLDVPGWSGGHAPEDIIIAVAYKVS